MSKIYKYKDGSGWYERGSNCCGGFWTKSHRGQSLLAVMWEELIKDARPEAVKAKLIREAKEKEEERLHKLTLTPEELEAYENEKELQARANFDESCLNIFLIIMFIIVLRLAGLLVTFISDNFGGLAAWFSIVVVLFIPATINTIINRIRKGVWEW